MIVQLRTLRMQTLLLLIAALSMLCGLTPAIAAGDDETVFVPIGDPLGTGVIRFRGAQNPADVDYAHPVIKVLVVYVPGAAKPPPGVAYFRVDQSVDCSTRIVSNFNYIAWDANDRQLQPSKIPVTASTQVPPNLLNVYWDNACPSRQPPGLLIGPSGHGGMASRPGVANAVARARERQALIIRAERLSAQGHFYEITRLPYTFHGSIFIDGDSISKEGNRLRLSQITVSGSGSPEPGAYNRNEVLIDCEAGTYRDEFRAWFNAEGILVDIAGEMTGNNRIFPNNPYDQPIITACRALPSASTDPVYLTIAAVQAVTLAGEAAKPR